MLQKIRIPKITLSSFCKAPLTKLEVRKYPVGNRVFCSPILIKRKEKHSLNAVRFFLRLLAISLNKIWTILILNFLITKFLQICCRVRLKFTQYLLKNNWHRLLKKPSELPLAAVGGRLFTWSEQLYKNIKVGTFFWSRTLNNNSGSQLFKKFYQTKYNSGSPIVSSN